jgi:dienelactone hydrolase
MMRNAILVIAALLILPASAWGGPGRQVPYQVEDAPYEGYYVSAGEGAPLVLLIHDWDGLTDYETKRAEMLAEAGYSVFAADLFGKGVRPTRLEDKRQHTGTLYKDRQKMRELLFGALEEARSQGADTGRAVCMGYCFGGAAVLELARAGASLMGFVTFHGGLETPQGQDYTRTRGEILILHGTADTIVTMEQFAGLARMLEDHKVPHEMITYGGARHAFTVFGSDRYNAAADRKSWGRLLKYLERILN